MVKQNKKLCFLKNGTRIHIKSHDFLQGLWESWPVLFTDPEIHAMISFDIFMVEFLKVYYIKAQNYVCFIWFIKSSTLTLFFFSVLGVDPRVPQV